MTPDADYYAANTQLYVYFRRFQWMGDACCEAEYLMMHLTPHPEPVVFQTKRNTISVDFSEDLRAKAALMAVGLLPADVFADCLQDERSDLEELAVKIRHCEQMRRYGE